MLRRTSMYTEIRLSTMTALRSPRAHHLSSENQYGLASFQAARKKSDRLPPFIGSTPDFWLGRHRRHGSVLGSGPRRHPGGDGLPREDVTGTEVARDYSLEVGQKDGSAEKDFGTTRCVGQRGASN